MEREMRLLKEILLRDRRLMSRTFRFWDNKHKELFGDGKRDDMCESDYIDEGRQDGRWEKIEYIQGLIDIIENNTKNEGGK